MPWSSAHRCEFTGVAGSASMALNCASSTSRKGWTAHNSSWLEQIKESVQNRQSILLTFTHCLLSMLSANTCFDAAAALDMLD